MWTCVSLVNTTAQCATSRLFRIRCIIADFGLSIATSSAKAMRANGGPGTILPAVFQLITSCFPTRSLLVACCQPLSNSYAVCAQTEVQEQDVGKLYINSFDLVMSNFDGISSGGHNRWNAYISCDRLSEYLGTGILSWQASPRWAADMLDCIKDISPWQRYKCHKF